jgi:hypothetical protein
VIVVDSVAALIPKKEIEGDMGDANIAMQARLMSQVPTPGFHPLLPLVLLWHLPTVLTEFAETLVLHASFQDVHADFLEPGERDPT